MPEHEQGKKVEKQNDVEKSLSKNLEKKKRLPPGTPNPVDVHGGARLRLRRTLLGMSQSMLGNRVGLTFQQIQKYERGSNRIGASRVYEFSEILSVPVSFFFDDLPSELKSHEGRYSAGLRDKEGAYVADEMARRETMELARAYYRITDPGVRKRMFNLVKSVGKVMAGE